MQDADGGPPVKPSPPAMNPFARCDGGERIKKRKLVLGAALVLIIFLLLNTKSASDSVEFQTLRHHGLALLSFALT